MALDLSQPLKWRFPVTFFISWHRVLVMFTSKITFLFLSLLLFVLMNPLSTALPSTASCLLMSPFVAAFSPRNYAPGRVTNHPNLVQQQQQQQRRRRRRQQQHFFATTTTARTFTKLFATSSKELRKQEEAEKEKRAQRRQKSKTTATASKKRSSTTESKTKAISEDNDNDVDHHSDNDDIATNTTNNTNTNTNTEKVLSMDKTAWKLRLQQATARAKAAAMEVEYANHKKQFQDSFLAAGEGDARLQSQQQKRRTIMTNNNHTIGGTSTRNNGNHTLGTVQQLTKILDQELLSLSDGTTTFNVVHGTTNPPPGISRDSMRSLLESDEAQLKKQQQRQQQQQGNIQQRRSLRPLIPVPKKTVPIRYIAVVLSKPLVQDQVTLQYACRLRHLAKSIMVVQEEESDADVVVNDTTSITGADRNGNNPTGTSSSSDDDPSISIAGTTTNNNKNYRPSIICFVGGTSKGNLVSDADAGYIFFQHLCAANQISLQGIDFLVEQSTLGKGALRHVMRHLRKEYVPEWLAQQQQQQQQNSDENNDNQEAWQGTTQKVQLHVTFFSCDYDLCRINDIHHRSPRQSILRPLLEQEIVEEEGETTTSSNNIQTIIKRSSSSSNSNKNSSSNKNNNNNNNNNNHNEILVETSWSYRYSPYPYIHFKDPMTAYLGKCFQMAEELTPVLVNIRGVVDGTEFFQRNNYRVLVSIRRSFVNDMESFYQDQPSLKSTLRQYVTRSEYTLDIVLEGALLSMGRCLDLVRPAGLLIGYVPKTDWKIAEMVLEHAVRLLRDACDPDHPLDPAEWGKLDQHYDPSPNGAVDSAFSTMEDLASLINWRLAHDED